MSNQSVAREVLQRLLSPDERIAMNLFELILESENLCLHTDRKSCILLQSNPQTPLWAWFAPSMDVESVESAAQFLSERIRLNPSLHVNADPDRCAPVFQRTKALCGLQPAVVMPMNAYVCRKVRRPALRGQLSFPTEADVPVVASLLKQLVEDGEHSQIPDEAALNFAKSAVGSNSLFLWKDEAVCAMAMIAHRTAETARINTVVTDRARRGHGYAGMLVSSLCGRLLSEGAAPMLYADARNPSSNRAYQKIGFEPVGPITEYRWTAEF